MVVGEKDVAWLHVAMHDAPPVDIRKGGRDIRSDPGNKCWFGSAIEQFAAQVDSVHEFEHEERSAMIAHSTLRDSVEQGHQAGGVEGGEQLHLIALSTHVVGIGELRAEDLERHSATERFVDGPVNGRHAAHTDDRLDAETFTDEIAGGELGGRRPVRIRTHYSIVRHRKSQASPPPPPSLSRIR